MFCAALSVWLRNLRRVNDWCALKIRPLVADVGNMAALLPYPLLCIITSPEWCLQQCLGNESFFHWSTCTDLGHPCHCAKALPASPPKNTPSPFHTFYAILAASFAVIEVIICNARPLKSLALLVVCLTGPARHHGRLHRP
jgi:hypothetical protein